MSKEIKPYIPADQSLPELTVLAVGLGLVLIVASVNMPWMPGWLAGGWWVDVVSLIGLFGIVVLLVRKCLGKKASA